MGKCLKEKSRVKGDESQLRALRVYFLSCFRIIKKGETHEDHLGWSIRLHSLSMQGMPPKQENLDAFEHIWNILDT